MKYKNCCLKSNFIFQHKTIVQKQKTFQNSIPLWYAVWHANFVFVVVQNWFLTFSYSGIFTSKCVFKYSMPHNSHLHDCIKDTTYIYAFDIYMHTYRHIHIDTIYLLMNIPTLVTFTNVNLAWHENGFFSLFSFFSFFAGKFPVCKFATQVDMEFNI